MSDPITPTKPCRPLALAPVLVGCCLLTALLLTFSPNYRWEANKENNPYGSDFLQEWTAASMIGAGHAGELYNAAAFDAWQHDPQWIGFQWSGDSYYPAVYPPPYYWLWTPLHWIEYRWAVCLWLALLMASLIAAAAVIQRAVQCESGNLESGQGAAARVTGPSPNAAWFWPTMLLFPPLLLGLTMGQKGSIWLLAWSVTWLLMRRGRPTAAGLAFGLLSIKPTLFFLLPLIMLRHGQWRFVAGATLTWAALWGAAACALPSNVWTDFLAVARSAGDYQQHAGYQLMWSSNLQSLLAGLPPWMPWWASSLLWLAPASYVLGRLLLGRPAAQSQFRLQNPRDLCQVLLATCLLSPHFYAYDLVVLLLPICGMWHAHRREAVLILAGLWLGMLASQPCLNTIGLPLMPVVLLAQFYWLSTVRPGQSSVRKGVSGRPAPSYILQTGLSAQA